MEQGVAQQRGQTEPRHRRLIQAGDELAAHAVPRIVMRLEERHRYAGAPERQAQGQTGQTAADDFDRVMVPTRDAGVHGTSRRHAVM